MRWCHLTGDKLTPDQLIQLLRIRFHIFQLFSQYADIGRTDRFVRFLGVFFAAVLVRRLRQVLVAEVVTNITAHHVDRILAQVG
ncbi:hypothetical protein D3C79_1050990 [compost metagenome]